MSMGDQIFLAAGNRRRLKDETRFLRIISGAAEVYAVTSDKSEFRQTFLMKLAVNDAAFPSMDEFGWLDTEIYAAEDTTVEELSFAEVSETELKSIMTDWFSHLVDVPWIRLQTDRGDDILKTWQNRTVLKEVGEGGLIDAFCENQQIFAMLMGMFFRSEDKLLSKRQATRERQKQRLLDSSIANLLDESYLIYEESAETKRAQNMEDAAFVMRSAMQSLNLPNTNISIPADIANRYASPDGNKFHHGGAVGYSLHCHASHLHPYQYDGGGGAFPLLKTTLGRPPKPQALRTI